MMRERGEKTYRAWEPERDRQDAHSPAAKLPEGDGVFFLLDTVPQLERSRFSAPYEHDPRGAPPSDPAMMVGLLRDAYCVGVFASRKIALACERPLACLAMVGQDRPDCRTMSALRKLPLAACKDVCVPVGRRAAEAGRVPLGNGAPDGTKIQGHASRHQAMRYGDRKKAGARLREDIDTFVTPASQQDEADDTAGGSRRGDALPAALARREQRLARSAAARRRVEAQAQADAAAERQRRDDAEAERQRTGQKRRGKAPTPGEDSPDAKAQSHVTAPARPIMRTDTKGWDSCGKAQASVEGACQSIVACDVPEAANDKQQAEPMAQATLPTLSQAGLERPKDASGAVQAIPAPLEKGDDREAAVGALET
jgi:hypothetical protein